MRINHPSAYSFLIVLFHAVGLTGFLIPGTIDLFIKLVPFHLLLMVFLLIMSQQDRRKGFWLFVAITYVSSFIMEMIGTNTGAIFGRYTYGDTLGIKVAATPLLIGVNWIILIYSVGTMLSTLNKWKPLVNSLVGALILVLLDILIEPVAVHFDYWQWQEHQIPLQNYVAWFIFSFLLLNVYYAISFEKRSRVAIVMIATQFIFFLVLNIAVS
jgi:bisanhydrobacterioruberin hydratase